MELRQLEYFIAVAETGSFTRAADRVHVSQSGVSAQVRLLERELGAELLDRSGRAVSVTTAGAAALEPARAALAAVAAVRDAVDEVNQLVRGHVAIGMVTACTVAPLFEALASFHRSHPAVTVALSEATSDDLVQQVRRGELDLALVGCDGSPPTDLGAAVIVREGLVVLVPTDHPLAGERTVALHDLLDHRLVGLPPGTGVRAVLARAAAELGREPAVVLEASAPDAVIDLARRGLGAAVVSVSMGTGHPDLVAVPVDGVGPDAVLALVWREPASRAGNELLTRCCVAFGLTASR